MKEEKGRRSKRRTPRRRKARRCGLLALERNRKGRERRKGRR